MAGSVKESQKWGKCKSNERGGPQNAEKTRIDGEMIKNGGNIRTNEEITENTEYTMNTRRMTRCKKRKITENRFGKPMLRVMLISLYIFVESGHHITQIYSLQRRSCG